MKKFYIKMKNLYFSKDFKFYSDKKNAMNFTSKEEAERIMNSNVPSSMRAGCVIVHEYPNSRYDKANKNRPFVAIRNDRSNSIATEFLSAIENKIRLAEAMEEVNSFLVTGREHLEKRHEYLANKLSILDKEIVDIIHFIEFNEFSVQDGYAAYKLLHEKTKERRIVKNEKFDIEVILNVMDGKKDFESCKAHFNRSFAPPYIPRALPELFQKAM